MNKKSVVHLIHEELLSKKLGWNHLTATYGISQKTVNLWVKGKRKPSFNSLCFLSEFLRIDLTHLGFINVTGTELSLIDLRKKYPIKNNL